MAKLKFKDENNVFQEVELVANRVTSINSGSTDTQYPTAKCVYDIVGDIETLLQGV